MSKKGNVCQVGLKELIDYHVVSGTPTVVSVGTTGEFVTLNHDEHTDVVVMTLELADGRIPAIVGTGANATAETIDLTQHFNDNSVVGYLAVTPYHSRSPQGGLYRHLKAIAEHTSLPQVLYNMPFRTGCDLLPETVGRPTKVKSIIRIEKATGNLTHVSQIKELVSDDFVLLNGDNASALDFMQLGGYGVISVMASVAACNMARMCKLAAEGHLAETRVINQCLMPLYSKLFVEPSPIPVKWACRKLGLATTDTLCLLMTPITDSGHEMVRAALKHASLL